MDATPPSTSLNDSETPDLDIIESSVSPPNINGSPTPTNHLMLSVSNEDYIHSTENIQVNEPEVENTIDNSVSYTDNLTVQDIDLVIMNQVDTEKNVDISNPVCSTSGICDTDDNVDDLWLESGTSGLVKVDEDFEVIVKSLETAIVETERYDIETASTSLITEAEKVMETLEEAIIEAERDASESLLHDLSKELVPSPLITPSLSEIVEEGEKVMLSDNIEIGDDITKELEAESSKLQEEISNMPDQCLENLIEPSAMNDFSAVGDDIQEVYDEQTNSLFDPADSVTELQDSFVNQPSILEMQEATMMCDISEEINKSMENAESLVSESIMDTAEGVMQTLDEGLDLKESSETELIADSVSEKQLSPPMASDLFDDVNVDAEIQTQFLTEHQSSATSMNIQDESKQEDLNENISHEIKIENIEVLKKDSNVRPMNIISVEKEIDEIEKSINQEISLQFGNKDFEEILSTEEDAIITQSEEISTENNDINLLSESAQTETYVQECHITSNSANNEQQSPSEMYSSNKELEEASSKTSREHSEVEDVWVPLLDSKTRTSEGETENTTVDLEPQPGPSWKEMEENKQSLSETSTSIADIELEENKDEVKQLILEIERFIPENDEYLEEITEESGKSLEVEKCIETNEEQIVESKEDESKPIMEECTNTNEEKAQTEECANETQRDEKEEDKSAQPIEVEEQVSESEAKVASDDINKDTEPSVLEMEEKQESKHEFSQTSTQDDSSNVPTEIQTVVVDIHENKESSSESKDEVSESVEEHREVSENLPTEIEESEIQQHEEDNEKFLENQEDTIKMEDDSIQTKEDTIDSKENTISNKEDTFGNKEDSLKSKEDTTETIECAVESKIDSIENKEVTDENKSDLVENKENLLESKEVLIENEQDLIENKEDSIECNEESFENKEESFETIAESIENKEQPLENKEDSTEFKEKLFRNEDVHENKEESIENKNELVENLESVEYKADRIETKHIIESVDDIQSKEDETECKEIETENKKDQVKSEEEIKLEEHTTENKSNIVEDKDNLNESENLLDEKNKCTTELNLSDNEEDTNLITEMHDEHEIKENIVDSHIKEDTNENDQVKSENNEETVQDETYTFKINEEKDTEFKDLDKTEEETSKCTKYVTEDKENMNESTKDTAESQEDVIETERDTNVSKEEANENEAVSTEDKEVTIVEKETVIENKEIIFEEKQVEIEDKETLLQNKEPTAADKEVTDEIATEGKELITEDGVTHEGVAVEENTEDTDKNEEGKLENKADVIESKQDETVNTIQGDEIEETLDEIQDNKENTSESIVDKDHSKVDKIEDTEHPIESKECAIEAQIELKEKEAVIQENKEIADMNKEDEKPVLLVPEEPVSEKVSVETPETNDLSKPVDDSQMLEDLQATTDLLSILEKENNATIVEALEINENSSRDVLSSVLEEEEKAITNSTLKDTTKEKVEKNIQEESKEEDNSDGIAAISEVLLEEKEKLEQVPGILELLPKDKQNLEDTTNILETLSEEKEKLKETTVVSDVFSEEKEKLEVTDTLEVLSRDEENLEETVKILETLSENKKKLEQVADEKLEVATDVPEILFETKSKRECNVVQVSVNLKPEVIENVLEKETLSELPDISSSDKKKLKTSESPITEEVVATNKVENKLQHKQLTGNSSEKNSKTRTPLTITATKPHKQDVRIPDSGKKHSKRTDTQSQSPPKKIKLIRQKEEKVIQIEKVVEVPKEKQESAGIKISKDDESEKIPVVQSPKKQKVKLKRTYDRPVVVTKSVESITKPEVTDTKLRKGMSNKSKEKGIGEEIPKEKVVVEQPEKQPSGTETTKIVKKEETGGEERQTKVASCQVKDHVDKSSVQISCEEITIQAKTDPKITIKEVNTEMQIKIEKCESLAGEVLTSESEYREVQILKDDLEITKIQNLDSENKEVCTGNNSETNEQLEGIKEQLLEMKTATKKEVEIMEKGVSESRQKNKTDIMVKMKDEGNIIHLENELKISNVRSLAFEEPSNTIVTKSITLRSSSLKVSEDLTIEPIQKTDDTKTKSLKRKLDDEFESNTKSLILAKPLSVQIDDYESTEEKEVENYPKIIIKPIPKPEERCSPKITIKPIKPPENSEGSKSYKVSKSDESCTPKITIKPVVKPPDPLKITITKQRSDDTHSILKIYKPEEDQGLMDTVVPKLTIKPIMKTDEAQHSPRVTIKPVKAPSTQSSSTSSMSPKITLKPVLPPTDQQIEITHLPKVTVKPVVNPEESYPKVTIKPILRPEESHKAQQLSPRQIKIKSMTFESTSGVTVEPITITSPKSENDGLLSSLKISVKPFAKIEEQMSPKLTIKPITKTCEIVQTEDGSSNPLKLTIKPLLKPEESYQSPKITIKPIMKPEETEMTVEDPDKPERIILKIQKTSLSSPKERSSHLVKEPKKEPEIRIEPISSDSDKNQKLDKIKLKLTKEGSHAQIIPSTSTFNIDQQFHLKRALSISESGLLEKRARTELSGTEIIHTSDISINLVEPNAKPNPKIISEEVTIMKIDKPAVSGRKPTPERISQLKFKEMLLKMQQKPDITCTQIRPTDDSSSSDDVKIISITSNEPLIDPLSLNGESSSQDVVIVNEVINTNPFHDVQIINTSAVTETTSIPPPAPKKRGRPRKNPLQVKPEIKGEDCMEVVRPKRTCRAPPGRPPYVIKERKPRGGGRGRGRGRGAAKAAAAAVAATAATALEKMPKEPKPLRGKALREAKALAKLEAARLSKEIVIDEITIEDSTNDTPAATPVPPPITDDTKRTTGIKVPEVQMSERAKNAQIDETLLKQPPQPPPLAVYEEETRMSADNNNSRSQTPARQVLIPPTPEGPEESQSSVQSTATTESNKNKKGRLEVCDPDSAVTLVEQIAEYSWGGGGPYMLQEQIAQYLGVKSFKRKYPGLTRRPVEMQERDYIREKGLVSESMCDMGLTVVPSTEILDIMYTDFQDKYEEYRKFMRDKQSKEISNKQKAISLATSQEKNKIDFKERAVRSAANWNINFNKARKESRRCCMDLQTFTINYPIGRTKDKIPAKPPVGFYPIALVPGQFTDYYKSYTSNELHYLPLNTVRYGPVLPNQQQWDDGGQSDGSQSDSDSSSGSDSDSSDSDSMSTTEDTPTTTSSSTSTNGTSSTSTNAITTPVTCKPTAVNLSPLVQSSKTKVH